MKEIHEFDFIKDKTVEKVWSRRNNEVITIQFTDGMFVNIYNTGDISKKENCIDIKMDYDLNEIYKNKGGNKNDK